MSTTERNLHYELVDGSKGEFHVALMTKFHQLCQKEFSGENEMESAAVWKHMLTTKDRSRGYVLTFTVVFEKQQQEHEEAGAIELLGGTQQEYYLDSNTALLPYVVVAEQARGMGIARQLVQRAHQLLSAQAQAINSKPLQELFIELSQKSDSRDDGNPYHSVENAVKRHKIWAGIGFRGLEFTFLHPGPLRNTKHQLCVYRPPGSESADRTVKASTLEAFFRHMFLGIMLPEGKGDEALAELAEDMPKWLEGRTEVAVGEWR